MTCYHGAGWHRLMPVHRYRSLKYKSFPISQYEALHYSVPFFCILWCRFITSILAMFHNWQWNRNVWFRRRGSCMRTPGALHPCAPYLMPRSPDATTTFWKYSIRPATKPPLNQLSEASDYSSPSRHRCCIWRNWIFSLILIRRLVSREHKRRFILQQYTSASTCWCMTAMNFHKASDAGCSAFNYKLLIIAGWLKLWRCNQSIIINSIPSSFLQTQSYGLRLKFFNTATLNWSWCAGHISGKLRKITCLSVLFSAARHGSGQRRHGMLLCHDVSLCLNKNCWMLMRPVKRLAEPLRQRRVASKPQHFCRRRNVQELRLISAPFSQQEVEVSHVLLRGSRCVWHYGVPDGVDCPVQNLHAVWVSPGLM